MTIIIKYGKIIIGKGQKAPKMKGAVKIMTIKVICYDKTKYESDSIKVAEHIYDDVEAIEVKAMTDEEVYEDGFDTVDEYKEYAVITFVDGETATFRNSYTDIFRW